MAAVVVGPATSVGPFCVVCPFETIRSSTVPSQPTNSPELRFASRYCRRASKKIHPPTPRKMMIPAVAAGPFPLAWIDPAAAVAAAPSTPPARIRPTNRRALAAGEIRQTTNATNDDATPTRPTRTPFSCNQATAGSSMLTSPNSSPKEPTVISAGLGTLTVFTPSWWLRVYTRRMS